MCCYIALLFVYLPSWGTRVMMNSLYIAINGKFMILVLLSCRIKMFDFMIVRLSKSKRNILVLICWKWKGIYFSFSLELNQP